MLRRSLRYGVGAVALLTALPAAAEEAAPVAPAANAPDCSAGCTIRLTPDQLLAKAEYLVQNKQYDAARPLVDALGQLPEYRMQSRFLAGYIAAETGELKTAEGHFRSILDNDPGQTRVRLELARNLLIQGKEAGADYHFRLAQNDEELPPEIASTIRNTRSILRDQRLWRFSFDFGFAPDTNINSATSAETIDINFGPLTLPLTLDDNARERSGIGQTGSFSGGLRIRTSDNMALLFSADGKAVNYEGTQSDDIIAQVAAGPELRVAQYASISLEAVGQQRWYGGRLATRDYGVRLGGQVALAEGQRIGLEIDGRRTESGFSPAYEGWQVGANATYEMLVGKAQIASINVFAGRDWLRSEGFSNISYGAMAGIGGELPLGVNAGVSAGLSRSLFDAPLFLYSNDAREDWRTFARAYAGLRQFKLFGFSPSVEYNFSRIDSNYDLYEMDRHRVHFKLARYF